MTEAEIQTLLDETKLYAIQDMFYPELLAFARAVEERTLTKQKARWYQEGVEAEREACAEICDRFQARDVGMQPAECAGAIRARGERQDIGVEQIDIDVNWLYHRVTTNK